MVRREGVIVKAKLLLIVIFTLVLLAVCCISVASASCASGVWNNFNYNKPATYWTSAARQYGGSGGVLDLVIAQAQSGAAALPFPYQGAGSISSISDSDLAEPYLNAFDSEGLSVILSIQPSGADVKDLIDVILNRYSHHKCVIGINVDMEWKQTGTPLHVSNEERNAWTAAINRFNPGLKLFLTYFKDYTYFPSDDGKMVVLYDGLGGTQDSVLAAYGELAKHFANVGIYTGYKSTNPPTASDEEIMQAAPNTRYILHTGDPNSDPGASAASSISLPSFGLNSGGFGMTGFNSKMNMPSMGSSMSGFPTVGLSQPTSALDAGSDSHIFETFKSGNANVGSENKASAGIDKQNPWGQLDTSFMKVPTFSTIASPKINFFR